jgi:hypothetical protein
MQEVSGSIPLGSTIFNQMKSTSWTARRFPLAWKNDALVSAR